MGLLLVRRTRHAFAVRHCGRRLRAATAACVRASNAVRQESTRSTERSMRAAGSRRALQRPCRWPGRAHSVDRTFRCGTRGDRLSHRTCSAAGQRRQCRHRRSRRPYQRWPEPMNLRYLAPTRSAGRRLLRRRIEGSVAMLNLLRFRAVARPISNTGCHHGCTGVRPLHPALVRHSGTASFLAFESHTRYLAVLGHRAAALEDARLLPLTERGRPARVGHNDT